MLDRRTFLKTGAFAVAATYGSPLLAETSVPQAGSGGMAAPVPSSAGPEIPATLDLAHHGALAINGVLGSLNPSLDYETVFLNIIDVHPAYMLHWSSMVSGVMPKYMEALPLLRQMSGSTQDQAVEDAFFEAMLRNMKDDGLVYDRKLPTRPWNVGVHYGKKDWDEDYANIAGNGRGLTGLIYMYQKTGDEAWLKHAKRTAERLLELAVVDGGMAWWPNPGLGNDFSYPRVSGWTTRNPPEKATEGFEGASMFYLFQPLRGFARYYTATGDERFRELSHKVVQCGLQPKFWGGSGDMNPLPSAERGHFHIHFHASMAAIRGILDFALVDGDYRLMEFAHSSYEYARQTSLPRLGLYPTRNEATEGCSIADMTGMAVALTDAGLGDYWDDVETIARNGLVCAQATDLEELNRVSQAGRERPANAPWGGRHDSRFTNDNKGALAGQEVSDRVLERTIGAFSHLCGARYQYPLMMSCCTANCSQALYYAWEGILRREGDGVAVNMWLNRRSPWADVWSSLPHEGRLVVANKGAKLVSIRKPGWALRRDVRVSVNGAETEPQWLGNRILLDGLSGNEQIVVTLPVKTETAACTLVNIGAPTESTERYEIETRGHTALSAKRIAAGNDANDYAWYRLFRRDAMRAEKPPLVAAPAYVPPQKLVRWQV